MSFIPLILDKKNIFSSEASLKYFLTQALASSILLLAIILFYIFDKLIVEKLINISNILILSSLFIKRGAAPLHFWFPNVIEGLSWVNNFILITWQKIAPLILISYSLNLNLILLRIFFSILIGACGGLNQTSLRKLIAFSSINHLGWIIIGIIKRERIWITYFILYSFLSLTIIIIFYSIKIFFINQLFSLFKSNFLIKFIIFVPLLSLGGLPPFLGFLPKWLIIEFLLEIKLYFILRFIIFFALITLFFYLRICYAAFLINHKENKWCFKNFFILKFNFLILFSIFITTFGLILLNLIYFFY